MAYYAGIDVSLEESSVSVVDEEGHIVAETRVASEPSALIAWFGWWVFDGIAAPATRRRCRI